MGNLKNMNSTRMLFLYQKLSYNQQKSLLTGPNWWVNTTLLIKASRPGILVKNWWTFYTALPKIPTASIDQYESAVETTQEKWGDQRWNQEIAGYPYDQQDLQNNQKYRWKQTSAKLPVYWRAHASPQKSVLPNKKTKMAIWQHLNA